MDAVHLVAYSDYLCPWCFNAFVRLRRLERDDPGVHVEWKSYLLRPRAQERDLEKFRAYTRSWERPAAEADAGTFQVWRGASAPTHSLPAQQLAKAASALGPAAFRAIQDQLFPAYFAENRDISDSEVLRDLWRKAGLPAADYARCQAPENTRAVLADHNEAVEHGASGVPAVRLSDGDQVVTGALPYETYRRWVEKTRARRASESSSA
jgi:predicted DsbA family dithiol-disulfide isomerase